MMSKGGLECFSSRFLRIKPWDCRSSRKQWLIYPVAGGRRKCNNCQQRRFLLTQVTLIVSKSWKLKVPNVIIEHKTQTTTLTWKWRRREAWFRTNARTDWSDEWQSYVVHDTTPLDEHCWCIGCLGRKYHPDGIFCDETRVHQDHENRKRRILAVINQGGYNRDQHRIDWIYGTTRGRHHDVLLPDASRFGFCDVVQLWLRGKYQPVPYAIE